MSAIDVQNINSKTGSSAITIADSGDISLSASITFDTDTLYVDASNNRVGIRTTSPAQALDVVGTIQGDSTFLLSNATTSSFLQVSTNILQFGTSSSDPVAFYANNAERMRIDASGNVGIGTTSPTTALTVSTDGTEQLTINRADASINTGNTVGTVLFTGDDPSANQTGARIQVIAAQNWTTNAYGSHITFSNDNSGTITERMRIDSSGNVGIGVTSPFSPGGSRRLLQISNSTNGAIIAMNNNTDESLNPRIFSDSANLGFATPNTGSGMFQFYTAGTERMRIDSSGNVDVNGDFYVGSSNNIIYESGTTFNVRAAVANLTFQTNGANERMRIDSSGDVLIGTSATSYLNAANRQVCHVNGGTDGAILALTGTASGSYPGSTGDFYIASGASGTTNTSLVTRSNGYMNFYTNNTERMRIDSSGNVGIGTTSPQEKFHVASDDGRIAVQSSNGNTIDAIMGGYVIYSGDGSGPGAGNRAGIQSFIRDSFGVKYDLRFYTSDGSTNFNEVGRFTEDGNLLVGATSATGHFTNGLPTATLSTGSTGGTAFSRTHRASSSNNATVDAFRFFDANGNLNNGYINGHLYVTVNGSSGLHSSQRMYYIQTNSNGTLNSNFTLLSTATRGTDPVSSIAMVADGAGGAVKIQITYINNSSVVNSGSSTISFIGQA